MPVNPSTSNISPHFMGQGAGMSSLKLVFGSRKNTEQQGIGKDQHRCEQANKHRLGPCEPLR